MSKASAEAERASGAASLSFERLAEPFRRELKLHCYRMLGSLHEAEDVVQETYLRAWRGFDDLETRGSARAWLYRIATNVSLDALARRKHARRLLPNQRFSATSAMPDGAPARDVVWLEPYPDAELEDIPDEAPNPEARYAAREAVQLAFVAVIQELPPRQRATLLLCDVLGWPAAEAAALLGGSTASVNSALQRARAMLAKLYPEGRRPTGRALDSAQHELLQRYLRAWEARDLESFVSLLQKDAVLTMPPLPQWFAGREAIRAFFAYAWKFHGGGCLLRPAAANRQPAFGLYTRGEAGGVWTAHSIHVLSLEDQAISALTLFVKPDAPRFFAALGLPLTLVEGTK